MTKGTRRRARRFASMMVASFGAFFLISGAAIAQQTERTREVGKKVRCMCGGCNDSASTCYHVGGEFSGPCGQATASVSKAKSWRCGYHDRGPSRVWSRCARRRSIRTTSPCKLLLGTSSFRGAPRPPDYAELLNSRLLATPKPALRAGGADGRARMPRSSRRSQRCAQPSDKARDRP